jgi:hypothetical protein
MLLNFVFTKDTLIQASLKYLQICTQQNVQVTIEEHVCTKLGYEIEEQ